MGMKIARDERAMVSHRFDELLSQRLADVNAIVSKVVESRARNLLKTTDLSKIDHSIIRDIVRAERTVRQIFVLDVDGKRAGIFKSALNKKGLCSCRDFICHFMAF